MVPVGRTETGSIEPRKNLNSTQLFRIAAFLSALANAWISVASADSLVIHRATLLVSDAEASQEFYEILGFNFIQQ